jgi:hypothetical protein
MPTLSLGQGLNKITAMGSSDVPSGLLTTVTGSASDWSIQVDWTAPFFDLTPISYEVEYEEDGGSFEGTVTITHPTVTHTFTGLSDGIYRVRVRAIYAGGNSDWVTSNSIVDTFITVDFRFNELTHSLQFARGGF